VVRAIPGFSGYLALSDGERGEVLVLTLWASEQQMRESEKATVQLRSQAADKVGATVLSVERFRVASASSTSREPEARVQLERGRLQGQSGECCRSSIAPQAGHT
jgi:heme-degrading monooxygenase HmoA